MLGMSVAALASLVAIVIVVGISMINEELNIGIVAIAFAIVVGSFFADLNAVQIMSSLPINLFMILVGVTFLFGIATTNGTLEKLTANAIRLAKGNTALIPLIIFMLITIITTIGPGNIATVALMAPVVMAIAARIGINAFLMTLLIVGAANGAAFSPIAPSGIISNSIVAKIAPQLDALGQSIGDLNTFGWKIHLNSEIAQIAANIGGFMVLGGWKWIVSQRNSSLNIDDIAPKPEPFNKNQIMTLVAVVILVLLVILPSMAVTKGLFSPSVLKLIGTGDSVNVGAIAFLLSSVLLILNAGDSKATVKSMPWPVIIMVCGMGILIDVMDKAGGLNALVNIIASVSNETTITGVLALVTGVISAYSSSSGVVMPMFLPMVPGLIQELGGGSAAAMISSINVGSHLVDTSPLSLFGAICIACADEKEDKGKLFRNLMIWGFSMAAVGAVICYIFFGLLSL
ncbi:C4-dicarboxylate ABC transporter|uniref:Transporter, UIT1 family n=1 Tax=Dendrosporobacter quercicolus TaxID=146817 RepID=A0A1G9VPM9_9FIRM|nr:SLC13 family permease [Dendrosporobacter quercicolus]NSL47836.1 C4-dicarboxylate ABC transporter [Dendrosporobacter quercicolus DSM 1736]SDM74202.1 transporter, UIT1 family [Dendrosporobacter quercicolus]